MQMYWPCVHTIVHARSSHSASASQRAALCSARQHARAARCVAESGICARHIAEQGVDVRGRSCIREDLRKRRGCEARELVRGESERVSDAAQLVARARRKDAGVVGTNRDRVGLAQPRRKRWVRIER